MAVRLRLMRMGKKKQPTYRVVAADKRSPRDGRFIEIVGTYNPRMEPSEIKINNAKAVGWLRQGAQPSDRVRKLLEISGAWEAFKAGKTAEELEAAAAAEAAAASESEAAAEPAAAGAGS
ncbi:MAG: 30S ribosomal protein S16 [Actinomycetia bacterium]|nr:30S ribosomal protein S16 [Actinomycetes bacterium]MCP4227582.1 30S ribosomal protein S16 [Actinomycetes bacterium]MCP5033219.1 30S ribosomal protein S16 [Actinomycetes bacterium]